MKIGEIKKILKDVNVSEIDINVYINSFMNVVCGPLGYHDNTEINNKGYENKIDILSDFIRVRCDKRFKNDFEE